MTISEKFIYLSNDWYDFHQTCTDIRLNSPKSVDYDLVILILFSRSLANLKNLIFHSEK